VILVRMLKRRDAASVVVAVAAGLILYFMLNNLAAPLASRVTSHPITITSWKDQYLYPLVLAAIELLVLEVVGWLYVWTYAGLRKK
jgi:hypothetical protein